MLRLGTYNDLLFTILVPGNEGGGRERGEEGRAREEREKSCGSAQQNRAVAEAQNFLSSPFGNGVCLCPDAVSGPTLPGMGDCPVLSGAVPIGSSCSPPTERTPPLAPLKTKPIILSDLP